MKVLVTGGTGFVGSHAVAAMLRAGHEVRLLVRRVDQVARTFQPLGIEPPTDVIQGDVTDASAVSAALEGCEAVVHSASVFSLNPRKAEAIRQTNVNGTRNVINAAVESGLDPVVHISSYGALLPVLGQHIHPEMAPGDGVGVYTRSKADQERLVRQLQERGAPVVSVMPGSVWGPNDPYVGESSQTVISFLRGQLRLVNGTGTVPIVDVRDLGSSITATLQPSQGPRRYLMGGTPLSLVELTAEIARLTGTDRRRVAVPTGVLRASGLVLKALERLVALPLTSELVGIGIQSVRSVDDSRAIQELGFRPRPVAETIEDTIRWLANSGHLGKEAGRLAASV